MVHIFKSLKNLVLKISVFCGCLKEEGGYYGTLPHPLFITIVVIKKQGNSKKLQETGTTEHFLIKVISIINVTTKVTHRIGG